ncbi:hypothetical protein TL16_g02856 [Triparma laevis f. inornata]|uniref:Uncharacterized protein n=1 Tax=Triparma laevis f. inornata TaxID=1714386 RepID=A0A9W7A198_9STRA|nr:hypothetical protein TL16_g02856 [Triparma laevis f. inornata]
MSQLSPLTTKTTRRQYIRSVYSSQVSEKKIPFSSLLKKDFTLEEISVLAGCDEYLEGVMPIPSPTDFAYLQETYDLIVGENNSRTWAKITLSQNIEIKYSPGRGEKLRGVKRRAGNTAI